MVMNLILIPYKLVGIPKNADLWRKFYYAALLNSHFSMGDLLQICCVFAEQLFWTTPMEGCFWKCYTITRNKENNVISTNPFVLLATPFAYYSVRMHYQAILLSLKKIFLQAHFLQISLKLTFVNSKQRRI